MSHATTAMAPAGCSPMTIMTRITQLTDHDDLRTLVLPILRRTAEDMLRCVSVGNDPATIASADWRDIADDLRAVLVVERIVGRPDDGCAMLNRVLDARYWERHE